jgi:hypothetical protein
MVSDPLSEIRPSVLDALTAFNTKFEKKTPYMYTDVRGLVTTGIGNLIDTGGGMGGYGLALNLPWTHRGGAPASKAEIIAAWQKVKAAWPDVQGGSAQSLTDLRIDEATINSLVLDRVRQNHNALRAKYPGYVNWPADAQLGLHSIAWAAGPYVPLHTFAGAVNKQDPDFVAAAKASKLNDQGNPGLVPRNQATKQLFLNAAQVKDQGMNYDTLLYQKDLPS